MAKKLANHRKRWTQQDISELKVFIESFTPVPEISQKMGRTTKSIYSKANLERFSLRQRKKSTYLPVRDIGVMGLTNRQEIHKKHISILDIIKDFGQINRAQTKSIIDNLARSFEPIRLQQMGIINNLASFGDSVSILRNIAHANDHWINLICQSPANQLLKQMQQTHSSWLEYTKPAMDRFTNLQSEVSRSLTGITHQLSIAEKLFTRIDINSFHQKLLIPKPYVLQFDKTINGLTKSYRVLSDSLKTHNAVVRLPAFILPDATRELVTTGKVLHTIIPPTELEVEDMELIESIDYVQHETSDVLVLLKDVDPYLVKPYKGAREALLSGSEDRVRHALSSLRELWNHLLRKLAPKEMIMKWIPEGKADYISEGKPTRKARILYVFRKLNNEPLSVFFDKDTNSLLELINILNRVHELNPCFTDEQMQALIYRTDSWLTYILKIYLETNGCNNE